MTPVSYQSALIIGIRKTVSVSAT